MSVQEQGRKPPFEIVFVFWAFIAAIVIVDILCFFVLLEMAAEPGPAWMPWLFGFILLLLSVIAASFAQTLKDGDQKMRYYMSYSVLTCGLGFSWPPSWKWLIFLVPVILIGPLWLPRARRFFNEADEDSTTDAAGSGPPEPTA